MVLEFFQNVLEIIYGKKKTVIFNTESIFYSINPQPKY